MDRVCGSNPISNDRFQASELVGEGTATAAKPKSGLGRQLKVGCRLLRFC